MAFQLTYAGVPFVLDREVMEFVEKFCPLSRLQNLGPPNRPGDSRNMQSIPFSSNPQIDIRIGEFFYPTGAGRWSTFYGLASGAQAAAMQQNALKSTGPIPQPFVMSCAIDGGNIPYSGQPLQTFLYMCPPRIITKKLQALAGDDLYLITLVDERYFFQFTPASLHILDQLSQTWASLIAQLAGSLSITATADTILSAYGTPEIDSNLYTNAENAGLLLDAVAWNVGLVVVRNLDGTYTLSNATRALATQTANLAGINTRLAGGDSLNETPAGTSAVGAIKPRYVYVTFPKYVTGTTPTAWYDPRGTNNTKWIRDSYGAVWGINVSIDQSGTGFTDDGNPLSTKSIHTTAKATYLDQASAGLLPPVNVASLQALATQLAADYFNWFENGLDEIFPGILPWTPEGYHDVLWTWRDGLVSTRIMAKPWNFGAIEFCHRLPALVNEVNPCCTNVGGGGGFGAYILRVTSMTATNGLYPAVLQTLNSDQSNSASASYTDGASVWAICPNGEIPMLGKYTLLSPGADTNTPGRYPNCFFYGYSSNGTTLTATTTAGSDLVTVPDTTGLFAGMIVIGVGDGLEQVLIVGVLTSTTLQLSQAATLTSSYPVTFEAPVFIIIPQPSVLKIVGASASYGLWDAKLQIRDTVNQTWADGPKVWAFPPNGETLTTGNQYPNCTYAGDSGGEFGNLADRKVYFVTNPSSSITVSSIDPGQGDTTITISPVMIIEVDLLSGGALTNDAGKAKLSFQPASISHAGNVTLGGQNLGTGTKVVDELGLTRTDQPSGSAPVIIEYNWPNVWIFGGGTGYISTVDPNGGNGVVFGTAGIELWTGSTSVSAFTNWSIRATGGSLTAQTTPASGPNQAMTLKPYPASGSNGLVLDVTCPGRISAFSVDGHVGTSGTFTSADGHTVTVRGGIITSIV